jgi:hypothetical protein
MSPTEFDLRAALRDGEGDGVDVDRVVAGGRARRTHRRSQLLSTAAVVAFVAAAGTGGALIWASNNGGSGNNTSTGYAAGSQVGPSAADGKVPATGPQPDAPSAGATSSAGIGAGKHAAIACPNSLPRTLLPGGGSPGQFGADGPMFPEPVDSIVVCSYGSPLRAATSVTPGRLVLTNANARALAASIENAAKSRPTLPCPTLRPRDEQSLAIIGVTARGTEMRTITTTLAQPACNTQVTNGTAVRYNWSPPANLHDVLTTLTPRPSGKVSLPVVSPSGKNIGSPVR